MSSCPKSRTTPRIYFSIRHPSFVAQGCSASTGPLGLLERLVRLRRWCRGILGNLSYPDGRVSTQSDATSSRKMWVESAVEAHGERIHALPQSKLQIMNIGATGKPADRLPYTLVIVVQ